MIRKANFSDLAEIMPIYAHARAFMAANGNPFQWGDAKPEREVLLKDIERGELYVFEENGKIHGVFMFFIGEDATYSYIEDGAWISDEMYGTIHRIASDGTINGIFKKCLEFCRKKISHLRIDTHSDNHIMQRVVEKNGFKKCGTIYLSDGAPRIAYELI